ncbi:hypothetical protein PV327_011047 [Microctonus hyperodae]|uniref:Ubiquitin-like protease family profile domain-containing protein n=1 Tax=Microctonus hyperodae TaxID=165561 RepID=A0AA39C8E8_MICHY|nr:hypothetical protein PV327_011047 [Microctonus hyperodae]
MALKKLCKMTDSDICDNFGSLLASQLKAMLPADSLELQAEISALVHKRLLIIMKRKSAPPPAENDRPSTSSLYNYSSEDTRLSYEDSRLSYEPNTPTIQSLSDNFQICMYDGLLMPYMLNAHWRLLLIDKVNQNLILMDPYDDDTDSERVLKAFLKYINECSKTSTLSVLRNCIWKMKKNDSRPFQPPTDTSSCALYVMHYIKCIGQQTLFYKNIDPLKLRKKIAEELISMSVNLTEKCLQCVFDVTGRKKISCITCQRWLHKGCMEVNNMESEDEDDGKYRKYKNKKIQEEKEYKCRLCRRFSDK